MFRRILLPISAVNCIYLALLAYAYSVAPRYQVLVAGALLLLVVNIIIWRKVYDGNALNVLLGGNVAKRRARVVLLLVATVFCVKLWPMLKIARASNYDSTYVIPIGVGLSIAGISLYGVLKRSKRGR